MLINKAFRDDPRAFMSKYPMEITDKSLAMGDNGIFHPRPAGVYDFDLIPNADNSRVVVGLCDRPKGEDRIEAYWLPWKEGGTTEVTLGPGAKYFFTAPLGGCRVQIVGNKVLHIAGDRKLVEVASPRGGVKPIAKLLTSEDPDQAAGVAWREKEGVDHGAEPGRPRKFSSTDYEEFGFVVGYATHGVWLFIGQSLVEENGKLRITGCKDLVGGEWRPK